jgi:hypothetical protein
MFARPSLLLVPVIFGIKPGTYFYKQKVELQAGMQYPCDDLTEVERRQKVKELY